MDGPEKFGSRNEKSREDDGPGGSVRNEVLYEYL